MTNNIKETEAKKLLENNYEEAEELLNDVDKLENTLQRLEVKLKRIPVAGEKLATVPTLISLVRSYINKEYTEIPLGSIIAIIGALIYVLSPLDLIPDGIPVVGYLDDLAVIKVCWDLVESDVEEYVEWRENNK